MALFKGWVTHNFEHDFLVLYYLKYNGFHDHYNELLHFLHSLCILSELATMIITKNKKSEQRIDGYIKIHFVMSDHNMLHVFYDINLFISSYTQNKHISKFSVNSDVIFVTQI